MNEITRYTNHHRPAATDGTSLAVRCDVDTDGALDLLQFVARWDNRKPSRAMAEAWATSAQLAGWTEGEAKEAIAYLATHVREYLTPAMVTARIESQRHRARLADDGCNEDGTRRVSFAAALQVWRDAFRSVGPHPSAEQEAKAAELLEQMLDGAGDPLVVLTAATLAGRRVSPRIDWVLEKIANGKEHATFVDRMPICPVEFIRDNQLDVEFAVRHADFPAAWRVYDPLTVLGVPERQFEDYLPAWRHYRAVDKVPDHAPTPRDLPEWVVEHFADTRHRSWRDNQLHGDYGLTQEGLEAEAEQYRTAKNSVIDWLRQDQQRWERERLVHVRAWYAAHPHRRRALESPLDSTNAAWWDN
ncbi:MAG TPA: hypothetical protein VGX25_00610 [Actinophytocola sp.]|uniref:hypothetical protein n=1 Tax=Actinophytocola sp. TaxID=1872138 RepID=UPI002DDCF158|nr:hypothetical protein [Actinophytocola sp.]HEV2777880.1 hypothetical protein [Actinophytocola sp.]